MSELENESSNSIVPAQINSGPWLRNPLKSDKATLNHDPLEQQASKSQQ